MIERRRFNKNPPSLAAKMSVSIWSLACAEPRLDNVLVVIACWAVLWWRFIPWFGRTVGREVVDSPAWKSRWISMEQSGLEGKAGVEA